MAKEPTIYLKHDWGRLGTHGYNVVGFSKQGRKSLCEMLEVAQNEECWVLSIAPTSGKKLDNKKLKKCLICLSKFEPTNIPVNTVSVIPKKEAEAEHRLNDNGEFRFPYCVQIREICHFDKEYKKIAEVVKRPGLTQYYKNMGRSRCIKLDSKDRDAVLEFLDAGLKDGRFRWESR